MQDEGQQEAKVASETGADKGLEKSERKRESVWEVYWPGNPNIDRDGVPVASFPMIIYFWPAMLVFLGCGLIQSFSSEPSVGLGWIATGMLAFNLMVIVTDLDQKKFVIVTLLVALMGLGAWITTLKDMGVVGSLLGGLGSLNLYYSTHVYFTLFFTLSFFLLIGLLQPRFNYWRLEPNEFVHFKLPLGRDQSVPRQGSTVTREIPDVLELLLTFGGGTLVIKRDGQVVARIEHVPFLSRRMKAIDKLLGVTRVKQV